MNKLLTAAALVAVASAYAQVTILPPSGDGRLVWTNLVSLPHFDPYPAPEADPTYRVEWAGDPNGPWNLATNTATTSIALADVLPTTSQPTAFFRVIWVNGQVWDYKAYAGQSLVVTGKLYFKVAALAMSGGCWTLNQTDVSSSHVAGVGPLIANWSAWQGIIYLRYMIDNAFWLAGVESERPDPASSIWTGNWWWDTFGGSQMGGAFTAEKIENGR